MKNEVLMHKGIALWLAKHTKLTNEQIAKFCNLHEIEVSSLRKGVVSIVEYNPVDSFVLSQKNIQECENNSEMSLKMLKLGVKQTQTRKTADFIKKTEVDCAILWVLEKLPNVPNAAVASILPCTASMVEKIKDKTYKHYDSIIPKHPVVLDLCKQEELEKLIARYS